MIRMKFSKIFKKPVLIAALIIIAVVVLGGFRIMFYIKSPDVVFLANRAGAQWIKYDSEFELEAKPCTTGQNVNSDIFLIQAKKLITPGFMCRH